MNLPSAGANTRAHARPHDLEPLPWRFGLAAVLLLAVLLFAGLARAATPAPMLRAMDVRVGVNLHRTSNPAQSVRLMKALGITEARFDAAQPGYTASAGNLWDTLCANGVRLTLWFNWATEPAKDAQSNSEWTGSRELEKRHPGCLAGIEGPNEVNNFPIMVGTVRDPGGADMSPAKRVQAQAFQGSLYARVHGDDVLGHVPVISYTDIHAPSTIADYANTHPYEGAWHQYPAAMAAAAEMAKAMPGKPMASTEWGYTTPKVQTDRTVTEDVQAIRVTGGVISNLIAGINPQFIYELVDGGTSPTDGEAHFGLFHSDSTPKAVTAPLQRLLSQIRDTGPAGFAPKPLTVTCSDPAVHMLVLAKSDGSYLLAFDTSAAKPILRHLTFTLDRTMTAGVYRLKDGTSAAWGPRQSFAYDLTDGGFAQVVVLRP